MKLPAAKPGWLVATLASGAVAGAPGCASTPEVQRRVTVGVIEVADPFTQCLAPRAVSVHREEDAPDTAVVDAVEIASPAEALAFRAAADRCGAWQAGPDLAPHVAAALAFGDCAHASCPDDWPKQLIVAMKKAPPPAEPTQCTAGAGSGDAAGSDWVAWTVARVLGDGASGDAALPLETWLERVVALGNAQLASIDELILERAEREDTAARTALARLALARVTAPSERLRFRAAEILLAGGDQAEATRWFNQIASSGRTAWRAFARAELERLKPR
ncbi:MAG: hypothetical protein U1F43_10980 [Myxococcota bacterium]